jgi:hypothetical protein
MVTFVLGKRLYDHCFVLNVLEAGELSVGKCSGDAKLDERSDALMSGVKRRTAGVGGQRLRDGSALLRWSLGGSRPDSVGRRLSDGECGDGISARLPKLGT